MLSGLSMLSLYAKGKTRNAKMRRFHKWRSQSQKLNSLQLKDAHRRQSISMQKEANTGFVFVHRATTHSRVHGNFYLAPSFQINTILIQLLSSS